MKILLISYFFPPYNVIGAVRISKLAEHWQGRGYDVQVISAKDQILPSSLTTSFPQDRIQRTPWINVNLFPEIVSGGRTKVTKQGFSGGNSFLGRIYKACLNLPDGQIGWYPFAVKAGNKLIRKGWKPDLIYASAFPVTSLLIAKRLASKYDVPWVAEYRDLWTDNHNYRPLFWRKFIDLRIEKKLLISASALITVSEPLASLLAKKTEKPIGVIMNGFDPKDYLVCNTNIFPTNKLNIIYTGMVYEKKQDPSPLFKALNKLSSQYKNKIRIHFFGRYLDYVNELVRKFGIQDIVSVSEPVPHKQSIAIQKAADVLLFLTWSDPKNKGILTGKIFEYFGAKHPILAIGSEIGLAGKMIIDRHAGLVTNDVNVVTKQIIKWMDDKLNKNEAFELPENVNEGLSREEQFIKLDEFLNKNNLLK